MPSKVVTATNVATPNTPPGALVAAQITVKDHIPKSIVIDNKQGASDHQIIIVDSFLPSVTTGNLAPTFTTINRFIMDVIAGDVQSFDEDDLKGVKCLGALSILADSVDANCFITVGFESE